TLSLSKGDNYLAVFVILRQAQYDKTILSIATTLQRETIKSAKPPEKHDARMLRDLGSLRYIITRRKEALWQDRRFL
ncbi:MAG: hypothetical protein D6681_16665, partial [Calditrichaeota bacterium]